MLSLGFEDAVAGKTNAGDYPTLGSRGVVGYVDAENRVQRAYGNLWITELSEAALTGESAFPGAVQSRHPE